MSETFEELGRRADQARQLADAASLYLRVNREKIEEGLAASIDFPGKPHSALQAAFLKRTVTLAVKRIDVLDAAEQVSSELEEEARLAVAEMRGEFERMAAGVGTADTGTRTGGPIPSADTEAAPLPPTDGLNHDEPGSPPPVATAPYRNGNRRKPGNAVG